MLRQTMVRRVVFVGVQFNVCVFTLPRVLQQKFVLEVGTFIFSGVKFCQDVVSQKLQGIKIYLSPSWSKGEAVFETQW